MLVKYGDFEDLEYPYKLFPETSQIEINNKDVSMFQCIISNISVVYGMDENQNNMTDFGYKALDMIRFIFKFIMNKLPATGGF